MSINSDYIKELIAEEVDPKKREVYKLAFSCFPLLNSKTRLSLKRFGEAMSAMAVTAKDRTEASGLAMLLERAEAQERLIKGEGK